MGFFEDLFDLNGDGKVTWDEEFDVSMMFEQCRKNNKHSSKSSFNSYISSNNKSKEEYQEDFEPSSTDSIYAETADIINQAQEAQKNLTEFKEDDYPNKRRYNAAKRLSKEFVFYIHKETDDEERACCQFISENADKLVAANYLSYTGGFLYSQAIKDNFKLPCSLPDEDEEREISLYQILLKIARYDINLSFEIWTWCVEQFLPYIQYDKFSEYDLTCAVIIYLYNEHKTELIHFLAENPDFCIKVMSASKNDICRFPELTAEAIKEKLLSASELLFKIGLGKADGQWKKINALTEGVIRGCENYEELESIEYFRDNLLPLIKEIDNGMVQDEVPVWEKNIAEYIDCVEESCEKYAFTRKNAWRKSVPSGEKYHLNPRNYKSEQEYLEALYNEKYRWRNWCADGEKYGLKAEDYETPAEYKKALNAKIMEKQQNNQEEKLKDDIATQAIYAADKKIYTYCGVLLPFSSRIYSFRTEDKSIQIGDKVIVPVGKDEKETEGKVVSIGQYSRLGVPYPVEKVKMIIRKSEEDNSNG